MDGVQDGVHDAEYEEMIRNMYSVTENLERKENNSKYIPSRNRA
jgi:hypothetical protein